MNMMDGPKFRRKHTSAADNRRPAPDVEPVPPLDEIRAARDTPQETPAPAEEPAPQTAKAEARSRSREKARRKAEFEKMAREEALRRVLARRERRESEARQRAEEAEAAQLAEEHRRVEEAEAARLAEEHRGAGEAEAARLAEERRRAEEAEAAQRRRAEEAEAAQRRRAEEAEAAQLAEERHRAEEAEAARSLEKAPYVLSDERRAEGPAGAPSVDDAWSYLAQDTVDAAHLRRNRIVTGDREDPAHAVFDVLRTRLLQALHDNGWKRVAITSPGKDCGKTFTAANLAISLSRQENCRTLLMDLDMRRPNLHQVLGIERPSSIGEMLRGQVSPEQHLRRMGPNPVNAGRNMAFALNDTTEAYASELLQDPRTERTLKRIDETYAPDVTLFDLPPALFYDDVIAFRPLFDGVLLVIGGGLTTQKEIAEVERRLGDGTPLLGLVLNKAEGTELSRYSY